MTRFRSYLVKSLCAVLTRIAELTAGENVWGEVDVGTKKSRHELQRILLVPTLRSDQWSYNDAASFFEAFPGFLDGLGYGILRHKAPLLGLVIRIAMLTCKHHTSIPITPPILHSTRAKAFDKPKT